MMGIQFGDYRLLRQERLLLGPFGAVEIGARSFDILLMLLERPNSVVGKNALLDAVWPDLTVEENTLQVHISALRKLLGSSLIRTVHGRGYKYAGPEPQDVDEVRPGQWDDKHPAAKEIAGPNGDVDRESMQATLPLPDKPSVAVLPFANVSGDPLQEYFSSGITDGIIGGLTRFRGLFVVAGKSSAAVHDLGLKGAGRSLGVAHVVEGTVLKIGGRLRVTARLVDAASGRHLWAENYDREQGDVFALQDDITKMIVVALAGHLEEAGRHLAARKSVEDMAACDFLLRGRHCMKRGTREGTLEARDYFERGLRIDPEFAALCACLADTYVIEYESVWTDARAKAIELAFRFAERAVALDPADSATWHALAWAQLAKKQYELSMISIEQAIALNPNEYDNLCNKGWCLALMGETSDGIACLNEAIRINPLGAVDCHVGKGIAEYTARRYDLAVEALGRVPGMAMLKHACLAACYAQMGRMGEAFASAEIAKDLARAELVIAGGSELEPVIKYLGAVLHFRNPENFEHLLKGLRMAGMED